MELFAETDLGLVFQECQRVLNSNGLLGVVGMAMVRDGEHESALEKT